MTDKNDSFEDWENSYLNSQTDNMSNRFHGRLREIVYACWSQQQKKIDELEKYKQHYDKLFSEGILVKTDEYSKMVEDMKTLRAAYLKAVSLLENYYEHHVLSPEHKAASKVMK